MRKIWFAQTVTVHSFLLVKPTFKCSSRGALNKASFLFHEVPWLAHKYNYAKAILIIAVEFAGTFKLYINSFWESATPSRNNDGLSLESTVTPSCWD